MRCLRGRHQYRNSGSRACGGRASCEGASPLAVKAIALACLLSSICVLRRDGGRIQLVAGLDFLPNLRHLCLCALRVVRGERHAPAATSECLGGDVQDVGERRHWLLRPRSFVASVECISCGKLLRRREGVLAGCHLEVLLEVWKTAFC